MYDVGATQASEEFAQCWVAAGNHLSKISQGPLSWLKNQLTPPFAEHLSFRMGNQLFFIQLNDVDESISIPGNIEGLYRIAKECKGHPCIMPMLKRGDLWAPEVGDWGLVDAYTKEIINPVSLVSDELIEMSDWELHDFGVQVVKNYIQDKLGIEEISSQGDPMVFPSLWFIRNNKKEWVYLKVARYDDEPPLIENYIDVIREHCAHLNGEGNYASVGFAHPEQGDGEVMPLYRGHRTAIKFSGLEGIRL